MPTFKVKIEYQEVVQISDNVMEREYHYFEAKVEAPTPNIATSIIISTIAQSLSADGKYFKIDNIYIQEI